MNKIILFSLFSLIISNCAGTGGLRKTFSIKQSTLGYLNDSKASINTTFQISDYNISDEIFPENNVKRMKSIFVPLLIFNFWNHEFLIKLGESGTENILSNFGRESLVKDLEKAGAIHQENSEIDIKINVTNLTSLSNYFKSGYFYFFFFFYGYGWNYGAKSIDSKIKAEIVITKNGKSESIDFYHQENAVIPGRRKDKDLAQLILNAMVETLSLCFKELNSKVVAVLSNSRKN